MILDRSQHTGLAPLYKRSPVEYMERALFEAKKEIEESFDAESLALLVAVCKTGCTRSSLAKELGIKVEALNKRSARAFHLLQTDSCFRSIFHRVRSKV